MHNNTKQSTGLPNNIPCKPLIAIMGWVMEQAQGNQISYIQEYQNQILQGFLESELADDLNARQDAAIYMQTMRPFFRLISNLTKEEVRKLNEFLLEICNQQLQKKYYRNIDEFISLEYETIDAASLWVQIDENTLQLEDEDTFATAFLDKKVFKKVEL